MDALLFFLGALNLLICVVVAVPFIVSTRAIGRASEVAPLTGKMPRVSVIVAARNEERNIETALQSLRNLDYDNLEIIVVEDRSTDRTPEMLDRIAGDSLVSTSESSISRGQAEAAASAPLVRHGLRVIHIRELPAGWLGKNHALYRGASEATGEYFLFTDADIVMDPSILRRAMAYVLDERLDHLTMLFRICMPNWLLEAFVITFSLYFFIHFQPAKVRDPKSKAHIGAGGFNLVRAQAYREMGTHEAISMRPDDDVKLGKLVKKYGFRQDVLLAPELMYVPWYASVGELIRGLEKNAFSGVDYSIGMTVFSSMAILLWNVFPFIAVFITDGVTRGMYILTVLILWIMCGVVARSGQSRMWLVLAFPIAATLFAFIQWRTMLLNLFQGGIYWRDTFYPLAELKANKV